MTAQIPDKLLYLEQDWDLAGVRGEGLFDPLRHGLWPMPLHTACWRGFVCTYLIERDQLYLDELEIALDEAAPTLWGRAPSVRRAGSPVTYRELRAPVRFTGGLLLARDFISDLYVHMGFHPAWKYLNVCEVLLDDGRVERVEDRSAAVAEMRERLSPSTRPPGNEIGLWVARTFSREY
jgi:hypothetical protein